MMTSNRPLEDWGKLVGDVPSATAILDRFLHHAEVISITGKSYRLRNQAGGAGETPAAPKPANAPIKAAGKNTGRNSKTQAQRTPPIQFQSHNQSRKRVKPK